MPGCSAYNCTNRTEQGFALKVFPRNPQRRKLWASKVKRLNWEPTNSSFLCEVHFDDNQWLDPVAKKLKSDAVPTIFFHRTEALKRKAPPERRPDERPIKKMCPDLDVADSRQKILDLEEEVSKLKEQNAVLRKKLREKIKENSHLRTNLKKMHKYQSAKYCKVFNDDQLLALQNLNMAGHKWSDDTIKVALGLRFSCGKNGYNNLIQANLPFPSVRTLQRRLQHLQFQPGILSEVFALLEIKVKNFSEQEKVCNLALDEMCIVESTDFDNSSKTYFGDVTFPSQSGKANHALVLMIGGVSTRWKQVVAYYFTNGQSCGKQLKEIVEEVIKRSRDIGLNIVNVTCDMGSGNRAMWKEFGISCTKKFSTKTYISNPDSSKITFMADVPHLLKNTKSCLLNNKRFILPASIVKKHNLPSPFVEAYHLKQLLKYQENMELSLTPKLNESHLNSKHFDKMKVSKATDVLNNDVSSALNFIAVEEKDVHLKTTAWFIQHVHKWFMLMTSRHPVMALSKFNNDEYIKAIAFLDETINLFKNLKVQNYKNQFVWKPIQTGILLSTISMIHLQSYLLGEKNFKFLLTSRFTQDYVENFFSLIRSKQVIPTALQFKNNLKVVSISQFLRKCGGSYDIDEGEFLPGMLELFKNTVHKVTPDIILPKDWDKGAPTILSVAEENCLYNIAGYLISSIRRNNSACDECLSSVVSDEKITSKCAQYVNLKQYKENCLLFVKVPVFLNLFVAMELIFRSLKPFLLQSKKECISFIKVKFNENHKIQSVNLPECHNLKAKIIVRFIYFRLKIFGRKKNLEALKEAKNKKENSEQMASKSSAMRALAQKCK